MDTQIPIVDRATAHATHTAIIAPEGRFTYAHLLEDSRAAASALLRDARDLEEARVAFIAPPTYEYVKAQWGIWRAGGIAVPLCTMHPAPELAYVLDDAGASIVIAHPDYHGVVQPLVERRGLRLVSTDELGSGGGPNLPQVSSDRRAMIIYTSGTTSRPKGAVSTHDILAAQIESVVGAWRWVETDHILNVLPLHHLHGILNVLSSALWVGGTCQMLPKFDAQRVFDLIADSRELTLFMAVPTIYARLYDCWQKASAARRDAFRQGCQRLRLMVSGSAALPVTMHERWLAISGHTLLERYGMTEIGMGLTNPLDGERRPGHVGMPFPGVQLRLVDDEGRRVQQGEPGHIEIKGRNVFKEYWRKPEATARAFTADGWFKTGDVALCDRGSHRILGRQSVDILKTGGYKVSALEIEDVLRVHDDIEECAVVGVDDEQWGQRVSAAVVLKPGRSLSLPELREWAKQRLAAYKVPSRMVAVEALPRNSLGKVTKPEVVKLF